MNAQPQTITIEVAPCPPVLDGPVGLRVSTGACIADVLDMLGICAVGGVMPGIWGRETSAATPLAEGDRIEFYRPLERDPKAARRARARRGRAATGAKLNSAPD